MVCVITWSSLDINIVQASAVLVSLESAMLLDF